MSDKKIMKTLNGYTVYDEEAHRRIDSLAGSAPGLVFDTVADMEAYVAEHSAELKVGQNLYIREVDVPDYWWDGTATQELETKVDLSGYAKQEEVERLSEAIADKADKTGWTPNKFLGTDANGNLVVKDAPVGGSGGTGTTSEYEQVGNTPFEVNTSGYYVIPGTDATVYCEQTVDNLMDNTDAYNVLAVDSTTHTQNKSVFQINESTAGGMQPIIKISGMELTPGDYTMLVESTDANGTTKNVTYDYVYLFDSVKTAFGGLTDRLLAKWNGNIANFTVTEEKPYFHLVSNLGGTSFAFPLTIKIYLIKGTYDTLPESQSLSFEVGENEVFSLDPFVGLTVQSEPTELPVYKKTSAESSDGGERLQLICFTDSIMHLGGIPELLTKKGITAHDVGVSSTMCTSGRDSGSEYYPYDLPQILTSMEKGDFSDQINGGKQPNYNNLSALLQSCNGILLEYGTNDFNQNKSFTGDDNTSICGAVTDAIKRIFALYPQKMIFVVSTLNYTYSGTQPENDSGTVEEMNEAVKKACNALGVPFIDVLHNFGLNEKTRGELTPDGLHTKDSILGCNRYAQIVYGALKSLGY